MNKFITLNSDKKIIGIRNGETIVEGEIQSDLGKMGQIQQTDGSFIDDTTVMPQPYNPTNTEIAQMISELQADLVIAGVI